jgi:hypothetical protein
VYLSRRSVACATPDLYRLTDDPMAIARVMATMRSLRAMGTLLDEIRTYFGLPVDWVVSHKKRLGLQSGNEPDVRRFLADATVAAELPAIVGPMRARLGRYLEQEQLLSSEAALVDIGWRGTILNALHQEAQTLNAPAPRGYFLGLWSDSQDRISPHAVGVLCDQRRGRSLHEGAAWHVAFLLEAVCRASHGITVGYEESPDGVLRPRCVEDGSTRKAERDSEALQRRIREGALAYARSYTESWPAVENTSTLRRRTQRELFRLAFFPTAAERQLGRTLVYSEPTSDDTALTLIADAGVGLRGWLAGFRSPWKGGYVLEHGGRAMASLYCAAESLLSRLPRAKSALRRLLIGRDGGNRAK